MNRLSLILDKMQEALVALETELQRENSELSKHTIDPWTLHTLSDNKQLLLNALADYDQQRQHCEAELGCSAPYPSNSAIAAHWQHIRALTVRLSELNQRNGLLLECQMQNVQKLQAAVQKSQLGQMVYGADGTSSSAIRAHRFNGNA